MDSVKLQLHKAFTVEADQTAYHLLGNVSSEYDPTVKKFLNEYKSLERSGQATDGMKITLHRCFPTDTRYDKYSELDPFILNGKASVAVVDDENQLITLDALDTAFDKFLAKGHARRNLMFLHSNQQVGFCLPVFKTQDGTLLKSQTNSDENALYVLGEVDSTHELFGGLKSAILQGLVKDYSIGGRILNNDVVMKYSDNMVPYYQIGTLAIDEVTLCPRGVNPESHTRIIKAHSSNKGVEIDALGMAYLEKCFYDEDDDKEWHEKVEIVVTDDGSYGALDFNNPIEGVNVNPLEVNSRQDMNMFNTAKYNNNEQVAQAYADSGYFFADNKMWPDAVESLKLSLNYRPNQSWVLRKLAEIYFNKEYDKHDDYLGYEYLQQSIELDVTGKLTPNVRDVDRMPIMKAELKSFKPKDLFEGGRDITEAIDFTQLTGIIDYSGFNDLDDLYKAYNDLGYTMLSVKNYEDARDSFIKSLSLNPDQPWIYRELATMYFDPESSLTDAGAGIEWFGKYLRSEYYFKPSGGVDSYF